jgi:hypothetical protein
MKPIYLLVIILTMFTACDGSEKTKHDTLLTISVNASEAGAIYLDGQYTGYTTPADIRVSEGTYVIGVATQSSSSYFRKELTVTEDTDLLLTVADKPEPKVWKALWVGIHEVTGVSVTGECSSQFSKEELDAGYDFFMWSIDNHFEPFSFNTTKWEVERIDINTPIQLHRASNTWFTLEPGSITEVIPEVEAGNYDAVFVFWREKDGSCSFKSSYFGLAWTDPLNDPIKTGYITIKFDAGNNIHDNINWYKENDPGVWVHEWLHTVGENYFQDRGERMPDKGGDGLVLHAAEMYHYTYPWMDWYRDFMSGQVKQLGSGQRYCGIGPEALLQKSLRESAME